MTTSTRRRPSERERAERRAQDRDRIEQAARELLTTAGWQRWVQVRARNGLARYSLGNQLLIAMQAPDARFIAGFHAWHDLGRRVRKGEHGIRILAPMPLRQHDESSSDAEQAIAAEQATRILFKSIAVFDVAQTDPILGHPEIELEPPQQPITGDSHAHLLPRLATFADELGYTVTERPITGGTGGWCDSKTKAIVVNATLPANARVRVLVHEIAHALGIGYADRGRARAEVIVDCVTYIACGQVGLDTSGETIPYIASWGAEGELDAIQQDAQTIDEVARRIETFLIVDTKPLAT